MKRRNRLLLTAAIVAGCVGAFTALTAISTGTRGPLASLLERAGAGVGAVEHAVRRRLSGAGRAESLAWVAPYRTDRERLERPDSVLLGAYDEGLPRSLTGIVELERAIGAQLPLVQIYGAWGDRPDQQFPLRIVTAIRDFGSIPVITWEPWLTDFENTLHPNLPLRHERERHGLDAVARGIYDFYIDRWAAEARSFGLPILVRFAHEMNDPYRYPWGPQNNTKEQYIAAWRHVVDRFRAAGVTNVIWVWSPHIAYEYWDLYYPGDSYVDWVATGVLNYGSLAQWSRWWTFDEIFGTKYERLASFGKPVMIAEFGSLAVGGDRVEWYREALTALPERYPAVKALLFFHVSSDQTITYQQLDWAVAGDTVMARVVGESMAPWAPGIVPEGGGRRR